MSEQFEPVIVGFLCNWCSYRAADLAGTSRTKYAPNMRAIRVMCSGRVDPTFVLKALREGADGVMIAGCHPGECHYVEGNIKALRRYIEAERVQLVWASASEGNLLAAAVDRMTEELRALGPLQWRESVLGGNGHQPLEVAEVEAQVEEV